MGRSMEVGFVLEAEISPVAARVPGSVQSALREAGQLPIGSRAQFPGLRMGREPGLDVFGATA